MFTGKKPTKIGHKPFQRRWTGARRVDFPTLYEASELGKAGLATLFYERGFFGLVWFEGDTRKIRDLKNW